MRISSVADKLLSYIQKYDSSFMKDDYSLAIIKYGLEITISSLLNIIIILLIALLLNSFFEAIVFLLVFISTRQFTGGFHAASYFKCNITFALCFILSLSMYRLTRAYYTLEAAIFQIICDIIFVLLLCPIINPNKPIQSRWHYIKCKIISVLLFVCWGVLGSLLIYRLYPFGVIILVTMQLVVLLCILSKLLERRGKSGHS